MKSGTVLFVTAIGLMLVAAPAHALIVFGSPAALNDTASSDAFDEDRAVSLAGDGGMNRVAAWHSTNSLSGTIGSDSDILVATSADDGESWSAVSAAMSDAATDGSADDVAPVVGAGNGVFVIAFASTNDLGGTIGSDQDILFTRSIDNGASWSAAALLASGGSSDGSLQADTQPAIATDGAGNWVVVWRRTNLSAPTGVQTFFSYSDDNGTTWSTEQTLGGFTGDGIGNGQGTAVTWTGSGFVAAWGSSESIAANGNDGDILYSIISLPAFTASAAALLNDSGVADGVSGQDGYPSLSADGSTVVAAWRSVADIGGAGSDMDIVFARSVNGGNTWSSAAPLVGNATTDSDADSSVAIANDGNTFLAVWDSSNPLDGLAGGDTDIFFARSDDGGVTWNGPGVLAANAGKDKGADGIPAIAANPATGTWNVAWESTETLGNTVGEDADILFVHSSNDCPALPVAAASCFESTVPGRSSLQIKEDGEKDSFAWNFAKGPLIDKAADIGSPHTSDDYVLCVYDETLGTPELISEIDIEAGGNCFVKPCWSDAGAGYKFKNKFGVATGASLTAAAAGKSKVKVKGKGTFKAPILPLAQDSSVRVRLHNLGNGKCFAADFSTSIDNTGTQFKAESN